ncbi:hypothetical protein [Afifella pfennigii]|uniref:hypothetical protein n=1 Tax=Afifella pfennigii TaxID=209897 RepID=UPI00047A2501|nr:hypothetical protein [Afifella pfennigii]
MMGKARSGSTGRFGDHAGALTLLLAAGLAFGWAPPLHAAEGKLETAGKKAEAALAAGETVRALQALEGAVDTVWQEGPLAFRKALAVKSAVGFGDYQPQNEAVYRPGEAMQVYVEPVGFAYARQEGKHRVRMHADLAISNPTGQVIVEGEDMFVVDTALAMPRREFNLVLSYKMPELSPGTYTAEFTLRDDNSGKSGSFSVPFDIAAPEPEAGEAAEPQ